MVSKTLVWDGANTEAGRIGLTAHWAYGRFGKTGAPSSGLVSVAMRVQLIIV